MNPSNLAGYLAYLEPILCGLLIFSMLKSKVARQFSYLFALIVVRLVASLGGWGVFFARQHYDIERHLAYRIYFYIYWTSYALEAVLSLIVIYSIFRLAMAPLKGLQTLGNLVFRWVAAVSAAIAIGVAVAPHASGTKFIIAMVTQLQQTSSILTLCLLLFVCFAIRPMGLSYKSRIFGVSFGLGVIATASLVNSAWLSRFSDMYSTISAVNAIVVGLTLMIWTAYFAFPEPKRRIIMLPTTSPFLRWNQISEVLGDDPGYVAIAGFPPELFAPAEVEIMLRASAKMSSASLESPPGYNALSA